MTPKFKEIKSMEDIVPHEDVKINSISVDPRGELIAIDADPIDKNNLKNDYLEIAEAEAEKFDNTQYGHAQSNLISKIDWGKDNKKLYRNKKRNDNKEKKASREVI